MPPASVTAPAVPVGLFAVMKPPSASGFSTRSVPRFTVVPPEKLLLPASGLFAWNPPSASVPVPDFASETVPPPAPSAICPKKIGPKESVLATAVTFALFPSARTVTCVALSMDWIVAPAATFKPKTGMPTTRFAVEVSAVINWLFWFGVPVCVRAVETEAVAVVERFTVKAAGVVVVLVISPPITVAGVLLPSELNVALCPFRSSVPWLLSTRSVCVLSKFDAVATRNVPSWTVSALRMFCPAPLSVSAPVPNFTRLVASRLPVSVAVAEGAT